MSGEYLKRALPFTEADTHRDVVKVADVLRDELTPAMNAGGLAYVLVLVDPTSQKHVIRANLSAADALEVLRNAAAAIIGGGVG